MDEPQAVAMIACPEGCGVELPEDDLDAQDLHYRISHPEVCVAQLREHGTWTPDKSGPQIGSLWAHVDLSTPVSKSPRPVTILSVRDWGEGTFVYFTTFSEYNIGTAPVPEVLQSRQLPVSRFWEMVATGFLTYLEPKPQVFRVEQR